MPLRRKEEADPVQVGQINSPYPKKERVLMITEDGHERITVLKENVPEEIQQLDQWVMWKKEYRDEKPTKVLYQTNRRRAASIRASSWTTFDETVDALGQDDFFDGVGFVFSLEDPYCGGDIDKATEEEARPWIERFDSYTERSPSGEGFHIICKAKVPKGTNRDEGELYSSGRFFTMTGDVVRDKPIREAQDAADEFYAFLRRHESEPSEAEERSATTPPMTDAEVVRLAENAKNGHDFSIVYRGGGVFKSDSERDLSLASRLAFWTQDEAQIERIMRGSGCVREKWDKHRTYLRDTIRKATDGLTEAYHPSTNGTNNANSPSEARPQPITAAELMEMEFDPTRWVVPDVLPEGLTLLVGKPKKGKSWMALGMCEAVAAGGACFGDRWAEEGDSLYLALEDNRKRLRKRLKKILDGRAAPERMHLHTEWPRLDEGGAELLDEWLEGHPEARLVVIDTLARIRKPARTQNIYVEDYTALEQLLPLAHKHGVAIVVVHHLRKMAASDPLDEISSSTGLTAGVDGFLMLRRTPGSKGPTLYVDGRDIEEPTEYALMWNLNTATWAIEGDAEEVHISKERGDILLTLNRHKQHMTPREVTDALGPGASYNNIKKLMWTMLGSGQLVKNDKGAYYPTNPTYPGNPGNRSNPGNPGNRDEEAVTGLPDDSESGNPTFDDTYAGNGTSVTGVTRVTEDSVPLSADLEPGESATLEELKRRRESSEEAPSSVEELFDDGWEKV